MQLQPLPRAPQPAPQVSWDEAWLRQYPALAHKDPAQLRAAAQTLRQLALLLYRAARELGV